VSRLTEAKDGAGLIGQFGVGFYSAFMVAERIVFTSRRAVRMRSDLVVLGRLRIRDRAGREDDARGSAAPRSRSTKARGEKIPRDL